MKRNKFNLSYTKLLSMDMGWLVPIGLTEVLPGDSFQMSTSLLLRCAPMLAPIMHPVDVRIHHWFVPNRLCWEHWEQFITGGPDGNDASVVPQVDLNEALIVGGLADYYGVPTPRDATSVIRCSRIPFNGYFLIWNEFYRDQDLQTPLTIDKTDGLMGAAAVPADNRLQRVCWEKDYFTSSRPWEQKGPAVSIPLTGTAPIKGLGVAGTIATGAAATVRETAPLPDRAYTYTANGWGTAAGAQMEVDSNVGATAKPKIFADLSKASAVTVNSLRQALALQRFEEARARYGSRYSEYLLGLGVKSSDARLQRPEYLGGGRQTIQFSEVLQTGPSVGDVGVGNLKGHGIAALRSNRYRRFFEEHGFIHTLLSVRPKTIYVDSLPRYWSKPTKTDYWQPELQNIGQQSVLRREVYARGSNPSAVFGYQDRYDEYRRSESSVAGDFRTTKLSYWHMAREFGTDVPSLNSTFVSCVPTERGFAVPGDHTLYVHARHSIQARRLVSRVARPMTF